MNNTTWQAEHPDDKILDPIDFSDIILMLQCNERKPWTKQTVLKCYKELLQSKLEDAEFILEKNIGFILEQSK
jgi:hypothetical protein